MFKLTQSVLKIALKLYWLVIPYFFGYKTELFPSKTNSKILDPSYKMDLDIWDCLGKGKLVLLQNCIGLIYLFVVILERGLIHLVAE